MKSPSSCPSLRWNIVSTKIKYKHTTIQQHGRSIFVSVCVPPVQFHRLFLLKRLCHWSLLHFLFHKQKRNTKVCRTTTEANNYIGLELMLNIFTSNDLYSLDRQIYRCCHLSPIRNHIYLHHGFFNRGTCILSKCIFFSFVFEICMQTKTHIEHKNGFIYLLSFTQIDHLHNGH